jgi:pentatricopeptide repeat protein
MKMQSIEPNEITYQMLIEALVQDGKPKVAYEIYITASNKGLKLSAKSYDTVMKACQDYGALIDLASLGLRPTVKLDPSR